MFGKNCKIAVVGAGAIGGITAGFISKAGHDVTLVCKYPELADKVAFQGLHIVGIKGDMKASMKAVPRISDLDAPQDVVFLATKATDIQDAARDLLPFLTDESVVVSMQNGICEDQLADILGRKRVIGCVVEWGATLHGPGELEMTSTGEFVIGNIDHQPDPRLEPLREMLSAVAPADISENIMGHLYAKLIINSCITSLGAICGFYLGEMLGIRKIRNIFTEIMQEAMMVADKMGIQVAVLAGKLDYQKFLRGQGMVSNLRRHLFIRLIGFKYRRLKSSSLQSLERRKPTEIDYLNGYIADNARKHGVSAPVNEQIVQLVKEIESGNRQISISNFDIPFFSEFG